MQCATELSEGKMGGVTQVGEEVLAEERRRDGDTLTAEGTLVGTVAYMAPELLEGKSVDGRTDLFALGVLVYESLSGRRPFRGKSDASLIATIMTAPPPKLESSDSIPPPLERLVLEPQSSDRAPAGAIFAIFGWNRATGASTRSSAKFDSRRLHQDGRLAA